MQTSEKLCAPRAEKYLNSRACSVLPTSLKAPASAKPDVGWRVAPACCAAQPVLRARRRSAVQRSAPARYPVTSGVQNKFFGTWHRAGGAVQFGHQCPLPAQTLPKERQLRSSNLARQMTSIFQPFQVKAVLANPSLNRTRNGRRCKPAVLRFQHHRTSGLQHLLLRAG